MPRSLDLVVASAGRWAQRGRFVVPATGAHGQVRRVITPLRATDQTSSRPVPFLDTPRGGAYRPAAPGDCGAAALTTPIDMGLLDYFNKDAAARRKRESCQKKLTNMYYQKVDRLAAAEQAAQLAKAGDHEAIFVLLQRFEHLAPNHTADREEKEFVLDLLIDLGESAATHIAHYITTTDQSVWWATQALASLWKRSAVAELLASVLEATDNGYTRHPDKKLGLVQLAAEFPSPRVLAAVVPFLDDHEERIRFDAVHTLTRHPGELTSAWLAPKLAPDEESVRVRAAVAEAFVNGQWALPDTVELGALRLPDGFELLAERRIGRRAVNPRLSLTLAALTQSLKPS